MTNGSVARSRATASEIARFYKARAPQPDT
jgi:hypothetical protein